MRLGIISDTHGMLRPEVFEVFKEVDRIIHAGDIGSLDLLTELEAIAPVLAVYGGTDTVVSAEVCAPMATRALNQHPNALVLVVPGMNHGMQRLDPVPAPKAGELLEDTMPPRMVEAVAHWLSERLR